MKYPVGKIRVALTLLLISGIYTETGVWTTIYAILMCFHGELQSWKIKGDR